MASIREKAYAKINLYLEVGERLPNGYHNIDTVMQTISLCDEIEINVEETDKTEITVGCDNPAVPTDGTNTVYKAAESFLERIGKKAKVEIYIKKVIPMCAGLGGGSADAAAVLRGLNKVYGNVLDMDGLCGIGVKIGADVPFCIRGGATLCTGIGEIFTPCEALSEELFLLVAIGKKGSPTPLAYKKIDGVKNRKISHGSGGMMKALEKGEVKGICTEMYNAFEQVVLPENPECASIKRTMSVCGAKGALMSGSGASVFGIFASAEKRENAKKALLSIALGGIFEAKAVNFMENID